MSKATKHAEPRRLLAAGFKLCELKPMLKEPKGGEWNQRPVKAIRDDAGGYGMILGLNGLCSLDPDNEEPAREGLRRCGFDLEALMAAGVRTTSTRPGSGGRSTFRAPEGLRWLQFRSNTSTILECRAHSPNLQDCLPGTVYMSKDGGGPYEQQYANGKTMDLAPELPADLLAWWQRCSDDLDFYHEQQRLLVGPDVRLSISSPGGGGPLAFSSHNRRAFNDEHDVEGILVEHGYTQDERSGRYAPHTASGAPSVRPIPKRDGLWRSDHASDPLHGTFDAWTAHVVLDHDGDVDAANEAFEAAGAAFEAAGAAKTADHFDDISGQIPPAADKKEPEPWDDPIDVCGAVPPGPPYDLASGLIPAVYTDMAMEFVRMYIHASVEAYVGLFYLATAVHVRPSVRVRERPGDQGKLYDLNEQAAIVGPSTKGKTSTMEQALGMGDAGPLTRWNQHEQARAIQIRASMLAATAEGKAGAAERKRIQDEYPIPDVQLNVSSDKELYRNVSANYYHDLPTSFVIDEWSEVYGGSHYRGDDGHAITVFWRQAADNNRHKSKTVSSSNTENERVAANLGFNCTEGDMGSWRGYESARKNGTMARLSLIAPGKPYEGERSATINPAPVKRWEAIQRALHEIHEIDLQLEPDPEFDASLDAEVSQYSQFAENGDGVDTYLAKMSIRIARHAALLFLVDTLSQGDNPKAAAQALMDRGLAVNPDPVVIPKEYRRRAWRFTKAFLWPHQVHVHARLAGTGVFRGALGALQNRIFCNSMKKIKRAEIVGSAGPRSVRAFGTDDDALMRLLVEGLSWLRPRSAANGKKFDPTRPWTAYTFDVNPKCMAMWELRGDFIRNQHAVARGQMLANFAAQRDATKNLE
jgi:hypothetical protein